MIWQLFAIFLNFVIAKRNPIDLFLKGGVNGGGTCAGVRKNHSTQNLLLLLPACTLLVGLVSQTQIINQCTTEEAIDKLCKDIGGAGTFTIAQIFILIAIATNFFQNF